jgi:hypothetical protein
MDKKEEKIKEFKDIILFDIKLKSGNLSFITLLTPLYI